MAKLTQGQIRVFELSRKLEELDSNIKNNINKPNFCETGEHNISFNGLEIYGEMYDVSFFSKTEDDEDVTIYSHSFRITNNNREMLFSYENTYIWDEDSEIDDYIFEIGVFEGGIIEKNIIAAVSYIDIVDDEDDAYIPICNSDLFDGELEAGFNDKILNVICNIIASHIKKIKDGITSKKQLLSIIKTIPVYEVKKLKRITDYVSPEEKVTTKVKQKTKKKI